MNKDKLTEIDELIAAKRINIKKIEEKMDELEKNPLVIEYKQTITEFKNELQTFASLMFEKQKNLQPQCKHPLLYFLEYNEGTNQSFCCMCVNCNELISKDTKDLATISIVVDRKENNGLIKSELPITEVKRIFETVKTMQNNDNIIPTYQVEDSAVAKEVAKTLSKTIK